MKFDNGEVLPGLNETWTFMGATIMEWGAGLAVFILVSLFGKSPATMMPFMLLGWVSTTVGLATLRRTFPDEERGLRNYLLVLCGITPLDIPAPAQLQPVWSACPIRELARRSKFVELGLEEMFPSLVNDLKEEDDGQSV